MHSPNLTFCPTVMAVDQSNFTDSGNNSTTVEPRLNRPNSSALFIYLNKHNSRLKISMTEKFPAKKTNTKNT